MGVLIFIYKVGSWKQSVDIDRNNFKIFMTDLQSAITNIKNDIQDIQYTMRDIFKNVSPNPPLTKKNSPIVLTQHGENLSVSIGARTIAEMFKNEVLSRIPDHEKQNPFIVEIICMRFVNHELMPKLKEKFADRAKQIEIHAYQDGRLVFEILEVVGVILRQMIFEELKLNT